MAGVVFVVIVPSSSEEEALKAQKSDDVTGKDITREDSSTPLLSESGSPVDLSTEATNIETNGEDGKTMEQKLESVIKNMKLYNAVWTDRSGKKGKYIQVSFMVRNESCEAVLQQLRNFGIGSALNSSISVLPCALCYQSLEGQQHSPPFQEPRSVHNSDQRKSDTIWNQFVASVGARLTVAQVVERVKKEARLTFDFVMSILFASLISAIGLMEDSTVIIVASMLVSPLMGPIMAGTFGYVIGDRRLQKMGVLNELIGILLTIAVGFAFGLIFGLASREGHWVTHEMEARGEYRSLWVGSLVAAASGAAAALAILSDNIASLVGVAISASLLPTAVNAGLLWALACTSLIWPPTVAISIPYDDLPHSVNLIIMGSVSLGLTIVNVIFIFLAGIFLLKIKEVTPSISSSQRQFWDHDIKIVRDYNKTLYGGEAKELAQSCRRLLTDREVRKLSNVFGSDEFRARLGMAHSTLTWSPGIESLTQDVQSIYQTMTGPRWSFGSGPETPCSPRRMLVNVPEESDSALSTIQEGSFGNVAQTSMHRKFLVTPVDQN